MQRELTYCVLFNNINCIDALGVTVLSDPAFQRQREEQIPQRKTTMTVIFKNSLQT